MTDTDTGAELEHVRGEVVHAGGALAELFTFLRGLPVEDDDDVQERIIRQVLAATTLDEISHAGASVPATAMLNIPIRVEDIRPDESAFTDGLDVYVHVVGYLSNGDQVTVSCGSQDVVVKLARAKMLDLLPCWLTMWQAERPTKKGYRPIFARIEAEMPF